MNLAHIRKRILVICALAPVFFSPCSFADAQLDEMMRQMNARKTGSTSERVRQAASGVAGAVAETFDNLMARYANVRTAPAEVEEDYSIAMDSGSDQPDSANLRFWRNAGAVVDQAREVIRNFPFPHFYWAPGIVGDATEAVFNKIDQEFIAKE